MIIFLFALLSIASGRVYPRSGVRDDVDGLIYEIPEYEDPELVLFNLASRGALPVLKLMQGTKGSEDSIKEKDTTGHLKIADVKKELDEIISGLQMAKNKGKHNLLMEIINSMQDLMKLKHHLFTIDISKLEEKEDGDDETSAIFDTQKKYFSGFKKSEKSSVASDAYDKSLVSDNSGKSSLVSYTSGESPLASDISSKSSSFSDTYDKSSIVSDSSSESPLVSDTSDELSLVSDSSSESLVSESPSEASLVSADPSTSYEHAKDLDIYRDKYISPYSLIRHISISDSPSDKLLTSDVPAAKESDSDIPAQMSFISDIYKGRYSNSDGSVQQDSNSREEEVKEDASKYELIPVGCTVKPEVSTVSFDAEGNGYEKKVKTLVDDNMYISESNQGEHGATIMSKKLTWKLRGLVEKPQI